MTGKTHRQRAGAAARWAALGLCLALLAGSGLAQEEAKSPEPLDAELIGIRKMVRNASSKLKNDIVGIDAPYGSAPATPAGRCCAKNLERIAQRVGAAHRILGDFDRCYTQSGNQDMVMSVSVAKSDLVAFAKTASAFANAPTKMQAQGALQAMTRTYNLLRETAVSLEPCEGLESSVDPDEQSGTSQAGEPQKQSRED